MVSSGFEKGLDEPLGVIAWSALVSIRKAWGWCVVAFRHPFIWQRTVGVDMGTVRVVEPSESCCSML